jgi:nitrite reductase/ring-hydroxylating ferredoxin subunit
MKRGQMPKGVTQGVRPPLERGSDPFFVCWLGDLDATGAKEFEYGNPRQFWGFVLRCGDSLRGYVNACPHVGLPLNLSGDHFFDADGKLLLCQMHGALFRPEDGVCVAGPCLGDALKPLTFEVRDGAVWCLP